ncbi:NAD-dependent epimerase/dehydratase family protein [Pseudodesulfovibrio pelocollis]|uniref:NAD-dependent epimerase/dehydratase family protein n=1 Tax=Pseudodesulfovibrio pelocollis TaxID=3051432 RepID=UPI00255AB07D|nr:NAD-dependent epimerase/dehydratase family protein [Pseudodesulfovibrio sp. SB368]
MRVFVTGATGFIGRHVVSSLLERGISVVAAGRDRDKLDTAEWDGDVERVHFDMDRLPNDLWERIHKPTHCIHLAWPNLSSYMDESHLAQSLPLSRRLLFRLIDYGLRRLVVAGTCLEYGMVEGELAETLEPQPKNPYAEAKNRLRIDLEAYVKKRDTTLCWARLFYMYGPGQNPKSLFAQLQQAIENEDESFDMSGGEQIRDYLPVEIVAAYLVDLVCDEKFSGTVNVCSGRKVELWRLVREYLEERGVDIRLNLGVYPYLDWEPFRFWGNISRLATVGGGHG